MSKANPPFSVGADTFQAANDEFRLLADIGGTNARFTLEDQQGHWHFIQVLPCADYPNLADAIEAYIQIVAVPMPRYAAVAMANPVRGDWVEMTNHDWKFSIEQTRARLGLVNLYVTNDFTALAMALPYLKDSEREKIGGAAGLKSGVLGLVGAGTGLGVSGLIPTDDRWVSLGSEGGHISFAPHNALEQQILAYAFTKFDHVSTERLVSGPGLQLIYEALCHIKGLAAPSFTPAEIAKLGASKSDPIAVETLHSFSGMLGSMAANVALMLGSLGGVYLGGGVALKLGAAFDRSYFRQRFEAKGRFHALLKEIPCYLITAEFPAFLGVSAILRDELAKRGGEGALVQKIKAHSSQLAPAERLVADFAIAHGRSMTQLPIGSIAQRAGVSEPTVIRFCRSMGFMGLSDFKLQLASGLSGSAPLSFSQVHFTDSTSDFSAKVLDNTISALIRTRQDLSPQTLDLAIESIYLAERVEIFASPELTALALEAEQRFLSHGAVVSVRLGASQQALSAPLLDANSVVLVIAHGGDQPELRANSLVAQRAGAKIICLSPANSAISASADIALDMSQATPPSSVSGASHDLVLHATTSSYLEILSLGVALRRIKAQQAASTLLQPQTLRSQGIG